MPSKNSRSKNWLQRHVKDRFVQASVKQGYRSRASFKLLQIHQKDKLFKPGQCVVDLGAAPGGWSQVIAECVGESGHIVAMDKLPMTPISGVQFIQGDFLADDTYNALCDSLKPGTVDWVISDMAPNMSGQPAVDQPRMMYMAEAVLAFAQTWLKSEGGLLIKVFHGVGFEDFLRALRQTFVKVQTRKPEASRTASREVYLLARGKKDR